MRIRRNNHRSDHPSPPPFASVPRVESPWSAHDLNRREVAPARSVLGSGPVPLPPLATLVERSRASSFWKLAWSASVLDERRHLVVLRQSNLTHLVLAGLLLAANPRTCLPVRSAVRRSSRWSVSLPADSRPQWRMDSQALLSPRGLRPFR